MARLSINVNKIALIRNSRGTNFPDLGEFVEQILKLGVGGITVHPRPDQRHIKYEDVYTISKILKRYPNAELNVEGYPDRAFLDLIKDVSPHQCTLVPDSSTQLTSDHGWDLTDSSILKPLIQEIREVPTRLTLFIEPHLEDAKLAKKFDVDAVEIYTEYYASRKIKSEIDSATQAIVNTCLAAQEEGMIVNAGHDLNLDNLENLLSCCSISEVSIGHAFTIECIQYGLKEVLNRYIEICSKY
ncbi:pyridoxine 5'-phosphate synthase [Acinetobacter boissieri]|uniref:Pyridoxine 5'-phosphate synthase n=1 Tax=Acinetobacter boissieri TaxID=1219383 RepID=A0A1G6I261_9GAMM|nr:pyridoxine 5'-phosphate synthase [Acinetobacter boissieri]SDC00564.1 pyridoxine 5'-phosphate synthase [Acinetobacter boissieri]